MLMMYIYNHLHLMGFHVKKKHVPTHPSYHRPGIIACYRCQVALHGLPEVNRSDLGCPGGPGCWMAGDWLAMGKCFFGVSYDSIYFNMIFQGISGEYRGISWDITNFIMIQCIPFLNGNFIIGRVRIIHRKWRYPIFREFLWVSAGCKRYWGDGKG